MPAPVLVLGGIVSVQFGATLAVLLIPLVGAGGSVLLRLAIAALLMLPFVRPRLRGHSPAALRTVVTFGVILGTMNFLFYSTLAHLPIGVAVTIEFLGPLALAAALSRRLVDVLAVASAALGVVLISRAFEVPLASLEWRGLLLGLATATMWAAYIVYSRRTGAQFPSLEGLAIAMGVGSLVVLPVGVASIPSWTGLIVLQGLGIAVLSSILPYSLELVALRRLSPRVFGVLLSVEPAVAALAGYLVLRQQLTGHQIVGTALVMLASVLVLGLGNRAPADPAAAAGA